MKMSNSERETELEAAHNDNETCFRIFGLFINGLNPDSFRGPIWFSYILRNLVYLGSGWVDHSEFRQVAMAIADRPIGQTTTYSGLAVF